MHWLGHVLQNSPKSKSSEVCEDIQMQREHIGDQEFASPCQDLLDYEREVSKSLGFM